MTVRFRGAFTYVEGELLDGDTLPLMRLRNGGSAARWGFAMYLPSKDGYEEAVLPTGAFAGLPEDALDCAGGPLPRRRPGLTNHGRTYNPDH